jgi:hypothetical protein
VELRATDGSWRTRRCTPQRHRALRDSARDERGAAEEHHAQADRAADQPGPDAVLGRVERALRRRASCPSYEIVQAACSAFGADARRDIGVQPGGGAPHQRGSDELGRLSQRDDDRAHAFSAAKLGLEGIADAARRSADGRVRRALRGERDLVRQERSLVGHSARGGARHRPGGRGELRRQPRDLLGRDREPGSKRLFDRASHEGMGLGRERTRLSQDARGDVRRKIAEVRLRPGRQRALDVPLKERAQVDDQAVARRWVLDGIEHAERRVARRRSQANAAEQGHGQGHGEHGGNERPHERQRRCRRRSVQFSVFT